MSPDLRQRTHWREQRRYAVTASAVAATVIGLAACSSSSSSSVTSSSTPQGTTSSSSASVAPLTVVLGAVSAEAAAVYIAQVEGYFTQQKVTVNVELQPGAEAATDTLAGRADIAFTGAPSALAPAVQGKQTQFLFATITGPGNASILVGTNSKYNSLKSLSGQQVSTQGVSGASWGETQALSKYNATHGGSAFNIVPLGTFDLQADAVIAGRNALDRVPPDMRDEVMTRFVPESGRAIFEIMHWGLDMRRSGEVDARKLDCPLLVLVGGEDRINPPGTVERVAALYRERATYEKFPGMSHWLVGEPGWEEIADRALEWLENV